MASRTDDLPLPVPSRKSRPTLNSEPPATSTPFASQPSLLLAFLHEMPKGGDLHNHLFGAIYAESLINFAARDNFCVDRTTSILIAPPCDDSCDRFASKPSIACAYQDHVLYNSIVDAWSMRNWAGEEPGHDHFFATFDKFQLALFNHVGDAIRGSRVTGRRRPSAIPRTHAHRRRHAGRNSGIAEVVGTMTSPSSAKSSSRRA